jgi:hypothetical protein
VGVVLWVAFSWPCPCLLRSFLSVAVVPLFVAVVAVWWPRASWPRGSLLRLSLPLSCAGLWLCLALVPLGLVPRAFTLRGWCVRRLTVYWVDCLLARLVSSRFTVSSHVTSVEALDVA